MDNIIPIISSYHEIANKCFHMEYLLMLHILSNVIHVKTKKKSYISSLPCRGWRHDQIK